MAEHRMKLTDVEIGQEHDVRDHASFSSWEETISSTMEGGRFWKGGVGRHQWVGSFLKTTDADLMGLVLALHFFSSKNVEKE